MFLISFFITDHPVKCHTRDPDIGLEADHPDVVPAALTPEVVRGLIHQEAKEIDDLVHTAQ